jgi:hypothetical protein
LIAVSLIMASPEFVVMTVVMNISWRFLVTHIPEKI